MDERLKDRAVTDVLCALLSVKDDEGRYVRLSALDNEHVLKAAIVANACMAASAQETAEAWALRFGKA